MQIGHPIRNRKYENRGNSTTRRHNTTHNGDNSGNSIDTTCHNTQENKPMLLKCVIVVTLIILVPVAAVTLVLLSGDEEWQTYSYKLPSPPKLEGALQPNSVLMKGVRFAEGKLVGPESLEMRDGILYTSTSDGMISSIEDGGKVTTIATFHQFPSLECGHYETEHLCGRPLGMRFGNDGFLYVVEAYSGLYKLNVTTGEMIHLVRSDDESLKQPMRFVNDLDVTNEGVVYFSDTSAVFERRDFPYLALRADRSGRIFKFDPKTNATTTVQENIGWANGVQVSTDEEFLLYSEGQFARIMKLHLKGPLQGEVEVFYDNLPGFPDNIRLSRNNTFWVAIGILRQHTFSIYDFLTDKPWLRTLLLKVVDPMFLIKSFPKYAMIIELDLHGNVIRSLHDQDGSLLHSCSEVLDTGAELFVGSFQAKFIGRLNL